MSECGSGDEDKYAASTALNTPLSMSMASPQELSSAPGAKHQAGLEGYSMEEATLEEKALRDHVREAGGPIGSGSSGMLERKEILDLGSGPEEVIVIDWNEGSPEVIPCPCQGRAGETLTGQNPFNWPTWRKYLILWTAVFITTLSAANCTSTAIMAVWGPEHFGTDREGYLLSLTVLLLSISFTPMVLAPLSEVVSAWHELQGVLRLMMDQYGRNMIYQVTTVITALLFIPQSLSRSYSGLLAARWFVSGD